MSSHVLLKQHHQLSTSTRKRVIKKQSPEQEENKKKEAIISRVSSKQKGDIAEARVAELITLYGDTEVSCFKPISDDEGIDLIVKPKGHLKALYIQVKSRFGTDPSENLLQP